MLYVYAAMLISSLLCVTGVIFSVINLKKYNFGLSVTLVAIVAFTISLAFFIIKPKICLGPLWFAKVTGQIPRNGSAQETAGAIEDGANGNQRRLMFFGFNTTALFRSEFETYTPESRTTLHSTKLLELLNGNRPIARNQSIHSETGYRADKKILTDNPSTTLIPPTPPSLGEDEELGIAVEKEEADSRVRAWTFTCTTKSNEDDSENKIDSAECWRQWQELVLRENPSFFLRSSFPLSERAPANAFGQNQQQDPGDNASDKKSWSTEEVVNLDEFLNQSPKSEKQSAAKATSDPEAGPSRKIALAQFSPNSWHRSHTVTVKYVPVKREWIPKPVSPTLTGGLRKKSRSTNAVFALLNGSGEGSPWWTSLTSLLQRAQSTQHRRENYREHMV